MKWLLDFLTALLKARIPAPAPAPEPAPDPTPLRALSAAALAFATGARIDRATEYLPHIVAVMAEYHINTFGRQTAFLAQIGHESMYLNHAIELWGPTPAQSRYVGRFDLGNNQLGDGYRFRGRGLIQLTGRFNYTRASEALGFDLLSYPDLLAHAPLSVRVAGWFWESKGCNEIADRGDFKGLTKKINGGLNGYADRLVLLDKARSVLA